ncbi:MAG: ATP-dependent protease subunit HslV [Caldicoprobacterales bacterium]|jgi:ATP-dependent HslUV protease subunit HslV
MLKGTTIVAVRRNGKGAIAGDGQVTMGQATIMKHSARKVRRLYNDRVIVGFAGSVADAFTLSDKFEAKLEEYAGNLQRAAVELAREWRSDKVLQKLEAMLIAMDQDNLLVISGTGEVIEPDDDIAAIGSGGMYAMAAAKALVHHTKMKPADIVKQSLKIASSICVYTNDNIHVEEIQKEEELNESDS